MPGTENGRHRGKGKMRKQMRKLGLADPQGLYT